MVPATTETVPMAQMTRSATGETPPAAEETVPTATEPKEKELTRLSESNHLVLYTKLKEHSAKWRDIGLHLGFRPSELDVIHAKPLLLSDAPNSWLEAILSQWLQWAPGDQRGSTSYATLEQLIDALKEIGLSMTLDLTE